MGAKLIGVPLHQGADAAMAQRPRRSPSKARFGFANAYISTYHILIRSSCQLYHFLIHKPA